MNISELIVKEIIDKIIIIPIYISQNKKIISQISENCCDFLKDTLNNFLSWNFISYDKDEIRIDNTESQIFQCNNLSQILSNSNDNLSYFQAINSHRIDKNNFEEKIFFTNFIESTNDWSLCEEPISNEYDRYASTLIKMKNLQNNIKKVYNLKEVVKEEDEEESKKSRMSKPSLKSLKYFNSSKLLVNSSSSFKLLLDNIKKPKINKTINEIMNEFSFHSIEDAQIEIKLKNLEKMFNFEQLRKDIEAQKQLNELDLKTIKNKRNSILNKFKIKEENNKKYRGKNITVDHNGEIIFIKKMKLDKMKKEFFIPKTICKFVKEEKNELEIRNDTPTEEIIQKEKIDKNEIFKKGKSKELLKSISLKNFPLLRKPKAGLNIIFNQKIDENEKEKIKNAKLIQNIEEENKKKNIKPFIPSGSCFNLFNLEVGVSLKEKNNYKSGGRDFFSKYKKYSISNFEKQLKEDLEINALKANTKYGYLYKELNDYYLNNINTNAISNIKNKLNQENIYIGNISQKFKSNISTNNNSSSKINQYLENKTLTYAKSTSSLDNNKPIMALTNGSTSLNDIFNSLDNTIILKDKKKLIKKRNIFRNHKNIKSLKNTFSLKDMNNFNKSLLTNKYFEFYNKKPLSPPSEAKQPEKPLINEIYKEIGFNKSISRNRNKLLLLKKPKALTTLEFFK